MSLKNIINLGLLGIIFSIITHTVLIFYALGIFKNYQLCIVVFSLISLLCNFSSIYSCFKYTKNNAYTCNINLIGIFSLMPIMAFNVIALAYELLPNIPHISTYSIMYNVSSIIYVVFKFVFLFSIYLHRNTNNLDKPVYKAFFIIRGLTTAFIVISNLHFIGFNIPNSHNLLFNFKQINLMYIIDLLMLLFTYKNFVSELIELSKLDTYSKALLPLNKKVFGN